MSQKSSKYTQLARDALTYYLQKGDYFPVPIDWPEDCSKPAGTFVSWHTSNDELRGCIGTFRPTQSTLAEEIILNSIRAGTDDPRFLPVTLAELPALKVKVDILSDLEPVKNVEKELDPARYGVFVTTPDQRSGLLLPDLPGVSTAYQQLAIACQKGGINPLTDDLSLRRFSVERHSEN